jgi:hypothetical protein
LPCFDFSVDFLDEDLDGSGRLGLDPSSCAKAKKFKLNTMASPQTILPMQCILALHQN